MKLEDAVARASEYSLTNQDVEKFCVQNKISLADFFEAFARNVASGYVEEKQTWEFCDSAMNHIYGIVLLAKLPRFPDFCWNVFEAFDIGELMLKPGSGETPDSVTKPLIKALIANDRVT
jgi:hypothetical protein